MVKSSAPTLATLPSFSPSGVRTIIPSRITVSSCVIHKAGSVPSTTDRSGQELTNAVPYATVDEIADAAVEAEGRHDLPVERAVGGAAAHREQPDEDAALFDVDEIDDAIVAGV